MARCGNCDTGVDHNFGRCTTCGGPFSPIAKRDRLDEMITASLEDNTDWSYAQVIELVRRGLARTTKYPNSTAREIVREYYVQILKGEISV